MVFDSNEGMLLKNINTMDAVENEVNNAFQNASNNMCRADAIHLAVFGEAADLETSPEMEFYVEEEAALEDSNGISKESYDQIIRSVSDTIQKISAFETPVYTTLLPTLKQILGDMQASKEVEFPQPTPPNAVQTSIHQYIFILENKYLFFI